MNRRVNVIGVGMVPFMKPGASLQYHQMATTAARLALDDARISYEEIEQVYAGYVYGDSTCGQRAVYDIGMTGIPVINVNNNCSTGSTALWLAKQAIESGAAECVMAVGFEQMEKGALTTKFNDRDSPLERHLAVADSIQGGTSAPLAVRMFGGAGKEYIERYDVHRETFGMISVKARKHGARNPYALFREPLDLDQVMNSGAIFDPLTRFQCCPPTCGAACAVLCSDEFTKRHGHPRTVYIAGQAMTTDYPSSFEPASMIRMVGFDMSAAAARQVYEQAGVGPEELDVVELHDCFTSNELISYEALGLCPEGGAEQFIRDGDNTYGGKVVTNPSGGLLSKGHPLGATGLAQCAELVWQLRGEANGRQVEGARLALAHNIGLGGACVVTMYRRDVG
ncbi:MULTISPECIES: lipid-transfer protein [unclassified Burkholderia]|uniref:lipid-transfer protein n=1 Tax=unclassified Burkholderia TaxID=2613784 RepID=UPI00197F0CCD|nr:MULTISPECIES: lipid-transfer protein [unclassified Burkholderia]MBN3771909.1 lipid-transfer protein [Burkholderia sp. Se-20378]MBN3793664.1 lipid-transfer protein [Burkholderia sp. Ac-20392]